MSSDSFYSRASHQHYNLPFLTCLLFLMGNCSSGQILLWPPRRDLGQVLDSQLPVALRRETPTRYPCSFIHSGHFYSASSSPLLLRRALKALCWECLQVVVDFRRCYRNRINKWRFTSAQIQYNTIQDNICP